MELMGDPQRAAPVIHITGTNGKGSTAQMITRLLVAQGLTVGHLHQPAPRAGQRADQPRRRADQRRGPRRADRGHRRPRGAGRRASRATSRSSPRPPSAGSPTSPSTSWWSRSGCSAGGTPPTSSTAQVAVVTNVGVDHIEYAGPTLADVAAEKAGHRQARQHARPRRDRPRAGRHLPRPPAPSGSTSGASTSTCSRTSSRSVGACSRCARRRRSTTSSSSRSTAGTRATTPLPPSTAVEAFFDAPLAQDVVEEAFAEVRMPGRFEVLGPPAARHRRRRPQPARRRHLRQRPVRRLRPGGPEDPGRRLPRRAATRRRCSRRCGPTRWTP